MSDDLKQPGSSGVVEDRSDPAQPIQKVPYAQARLDFEKEGGLVPAIVQDHQTKEVLMVGFMNPEAWEKTVRTGMVTFWSRTRQTLWTKGETSGNFLGVKKIFIDCDNDTVLVEAEPKGPTCHTGARSCFFQEVLTNA